MVRDENVRKKNVMIRKVRSRNKGIVRGENYSFHKLMREKSERTPLKIRLTTHL